MPMSPCHFPFPDIRLRTSEPSEMVHLLPGSNHFNLVEAEMADFPNTITGHTVGSAISEYLEDGAEATENVSPFTARLLFQSALQ
jgi:hypothetical protein